MTEVPVGRRERKKNRTRQAIADAALRLFTEHGYDQVSVRAVAEAADVSMSGLFKHFPCKEALVFDREDDYRAALVGAVRDRPAGTPVLDALRDWLLSLSMDAPPADDPYFDLIRQTPALREYSERMWMRNEDDLAEVVTSNVPGADIAGKALARFVLDRTIPRLGDDAHAAIHAAFDLLTHGWQDPSGTVTPAGQTDADTDAEPARPGLRQRAKERTRRRINETAARLFIERGYDHVGVREIADAAETSVATLFKHFPGGKVTLVFGADGDERTAPLLTAVQTRPAGQPILRTVRDFMLSDGPFRATTSPEFRRAQHLVIATPALREQARKLWLSGQDALAATIAATSGRPADDLTVRVLARYILQIPDLALPYPDPRAALDVIVDLLQRGWPACLSS